MDIYSRTSEQHTYTPGNIFLLEEGEAMLAWDKENFRARILDRTFNGRVGKVKLLTVDVWDSIGSS